MAPLLKPGGRRRRATWRQLAHHLGAGHDMAQRTLGHLGRYLRPVFHPCHLSDADVLAATVLARQAATVPPSIVPATPRT